MRCSPVTAWPSCPPTWPARKSGAAAWQTILDDYEPLTGFGRQLYACYTPSRVRLPKVRVFLEELERQFTPPSPVGKLQVGKAKPLSLRYMFDRVGVGHPGHEIGNLQQANVGIGIRLAVMAEELRRQQLQQHAVRGS